MRLQEAVICTYCNNSKANTYASMSSVFGVEIQCYGCGFHLKLKFKPHPNLGKIVWDKEDKYKRDLRDCHDLLNDCGFFYEEGKWIDGDNREEGEEE